MALSLMMVLLLGAGAEPLKLTIQTWDFAGSRGLIEVSTKPDEICRLSLDGSDQITTPTPLGIPSDARELTIRSNVQFKEIEGGANLVRDTQRLILLDFSPMIAKLRDKERSFGQRVRAYLDAKAAFERQHKDLLDGVELIVEAEEPARPEEIAAAEIRLRFALPKDYVSLVLESGPLQIEDSYTHAPSSLKNAYDTMLEDWGTPKAALDESISPATRKLLEASTILFTEVGDGYGALIFEPSRIVGTPGRFYWTHQDDIDRPALLKTPEGRPMDFSDAFLWILATLGLAAYEDLRADLVVIDRSAPREMPMLLERHGEGFVLVPIWSKYP